MRKQIGGSFAPPLTDEALDKYAKLIDAIPKNSQLRDSLEKVYVCCTKWWDAPESEGTDVHKHPSGRGLIIDLEKNIADSLFDVIPWMEELDIIGNVFDKITDNKELRNAAFHMLWHCKELCLDREPMTSDKL